jgi:hypothetical protein
MILHQSLHVMRSQSVRRRPPPLSQPDVFFPAVRTLERGVHTPASAPLSLERDGSSYHPVCDWWIPGVFGGFPDGEGSSGEGAWYIRAISGDSLCSLPASVILFVFWFLVVFCCLPQQTTMLDFRSKL